jgi:hypothetical protein
MLAFLTHSVLTTAKSPKSHIALPESYRRLIDTVGFDRLRCNLRFLMSATLYGRKSEYVDSSWVHEPDFTLRSCTYHFVWRARATTHAGVVGISVDVTTAEVGGIVTVAGPCWTSKYIPAMGWPR